MMREILKQLVLVCLILLGVGANAFALEQQLQTNVRTEQDLEDITVVSSPLGIFVLINTKDICMTIECVLSDLQTQKCLKYEAVPCGHAES